MAVSAIVVLTPAITHALEIGKLRVYSALTSPLEAEIGLVAPTAAELGTLVAQVVLPANFTGSLESQQLLSNIKVTVTKRSDQSYFLQLRSTQPLTEPVLHFVLAATWESGRSVKEFTALIDPPRSPLVESAKTEQSTAADKTAIQSAAPQQAAASPSPSESVAPAPSKAPTPLPAVDTSQRAKPIGADKDRKPAAPGASQDLAAVKESNVEAPQEKPRPQAPALAPQTAAAHPSELVSSPPKESRATATQAAFLGPRKSVSSTEVTPPSSDSRDLSSVVTQLVQENPTVALALVASLALALLLLAAALTVLSIKLHRRHAQRLETKLPTPKLVKPTNIPQPEALSEGNRRQRDRRQRIDRRQQSIPVAIERRSGLSRRRSELTDGGNTTVCVEVSDPIAEAEAYLAGGFYSHAEQALQDALRRDPSRLDIKVKLLEVYEQSGNVPAFRILSEELQPESEHGGSEQTHNVGARDRGVNSEETVLLNDLPVPEESEIPAASPTRKNGSEKQSIATGNRHTVEWEADMEAVGSAPIVAAPTQHECEIEGLPYLSGPTVTVTLEEAFNEFLRARKRLKADTIAGYKRLMATALADWSERDLLEISADLVSKRHSELLQEHGKAYANRSMRFLRTLYDFALERYQDGSDRQVPRNPVQCL